MTFTSPAKTFKTLQPGDPDFQMSNGIALVPRAAIEISNDCPYNHLQILQTCIDRGWIKPIAYMRDSEYVWEKLGD